MFFMANTTIIKEGMCSSSPCSRFNGSHRVSYPGFNDAFVESYTNVYIAPSVLLLSNFLDSQTYDFSENPPSVFTKLTLDHKVDQQNACVDPDSEYMQICDDPQSLSGIFFLIKFIVFLSFPLWIAISFGIYKLYSWNKKVGITFLIIVFMTLGFFKIILYDPLNYDHDGKPETLKHIISHII